jgi:hypothetical protein
LLFLLKQPKMTKLKLIAIVSLFSLVFISCDADDDTVQQRDNSRYVSNVDFLMTGSQVRPVPSTSTASGSIEGTYDKRTKVYTYKVMWSGLSGTVASMHIHGIADRGFVALPSPLGPHTNGIIQTISGSTASSGSYSGTLLIDGVAIKEENFLAGKYYIDIHTATRPGGEIRAQIQFP